MCLKNIIQFKILLAPDHLHKLTNNKIKHVLYTHKPMNTDLWSMELKVHMAIQILTHKLNILLIQYKLLNHISDIVKTHTNRVFLMKTLI